MATFNAINVEIAENVGYDDGSGDFLASKDLTETIIKKYTNKRYYQLISKLAGKYPEDYERVSTANFYKTTGTVDSVSGSTLTAATAIFNNNMIDDTIYNSTQSVTVKIDSYTSTTVVVADASVATWAAGDTIYVLGHEFALGGDADDARYIISVGVKYNTGDDYFTTCKRMGLNKVFALGSESYTEDRPVWYSTNTKVSDVFTKTVGILPENDTAVASGIQIRYVEMPDAMSDDDDVPVLPLGSHELLIAGGTIDALKKLGRPEEIAPYREEWIRGVSDMVGDYARSRVQPELGERTQHYYDIRMRNK